MRGNLVVVKGEKIMTNLYVPLRDTLQEGDATIALISQEEMVIKWHRTLC